MLLDSIAPNCRQVDSIDALLQIILIAKPKRAS